MSGERWSVGKDSTFTAGGKTNFDVNLLRHSSRLGGYLKGSLFDQRLINKIIK